jgi:hypothetical protein
MENHADIAWGGKMMVEFEKVRVWNVMSVDCVSVQSNIRLELMSKAMFNTRIGPVKFLVVFNPNAITSPLVKMFLLMSFRYGPGWGGNLNMETRIATTCE